MFCYGHHVKIVLERFKLNIIYAFDFCGLNKDTYVQLFFHCMYSKVSGIVTQNFLKTSQMVMLHGSDIFI